MYVIKRFPHSSSGSRRARQTVCSLCAPYRWASDAARCQLPVSVDLVTGQARLTELSMARNMFGD